MYTQIDINNAAGGNLRGLSVEEAWENIKDCAQCDKQWKNPTSTICDQTIANLKDQLVGNDVVRVKIPSYMSWLDAYEEPLEVEETLGTPIEEEPLDQTKLEDVGLTSHNISLSSGEVPSLDEPKPQPQPLPSCPSFDVSLENQRGPEPPINLPSPDSFRMKEVDHLTNHTPPSPHVASFYPKDVYCYYHSCAEDPTKHYGFKPSLLGHSGSLGVDFSNFEMIEDDWRLESKEVSFLREGLNLPVWPKELEKVLSLDLTNKIARRKFLIKNEKEFFTVPGDGIGIKPDGVASPVFSTWMTFRGNTRDLDSFEEETNKITDLQQIHKEVLFTVRGDGIACIKRCHRDLSSNGDRDLATASGRDRLKEDLESFT
ncbi:hypothetical protein Tco_0795325 [Tanacetum coccineum]